MWRWGWLCLALAIAPAMAWSAPPCASMALPGTGEPVAAVGTNDGGVVHVFRKRGQELSAQVEVVGLDAAGKQRFSTRLGAADAWTSPDAAVLIGRDEARRIVIAGETDASVGKADTLGLQAWLVAIDLSGKVIWELKVGGKARESFHGVAAQAGGDVVAVGYISKGPAGREDGLVVRVDPAGKVRWEKTFGGPGNDSLEAVAVRADGVSVAVGYEQGKAWVLGLKADGSEAFEAYTPTNTDRLHDVVVGKGGAVWAAGRTWDPKGRDFGLLVSIGEDGKLLGRVAAVQGPYPELSKLVVTPLGMMGVGSVGDDDHARLWLVHFGHDGQRRWDLTASEGWMPLEAAGATLVTGRAGAVGGSSDHVVLQARGMSGENPYAENRGFRIPQDAPPRCIAGEWLLRGPNPIFAASAGPTWFKTGTKFVWGYRHGQTDTNLRGELTTVKPNVVMTWQIGDGKRLAGTLNLDTAALSDARGGDYTLKGGTEYLVDTALFRVSRLVRGELANGGRTELQLEGRPVVFKRTAREMVPLNLDGKTVKVSAIRAKGEGQGNTWELVVLDDKAHPLVLSLVKGETTMVWLNGVMTR